MHDPGCAAVPGSACGKAAGAEATAPGALHAMQPIPNNALQFSRHSPPTGMRPQPQVVHTRCFESHLAQYSRYLSVPGHWLPPSFADSTHFQPSAVGFQLAMHRAQRKSIVYSMHLGTATQLLLEVMLRAAACTWAALVHIDSWAGTLMYMAALLRRTPLLQRLQVPSGLHSAHLGFFDVSLHLAGVLLPVGTHL